MDRSQAAASNLMDMHNRLIADILTRFRTLIMSATIQAQGDRNSANPETISVARISMKLEFDGLFSSIKDLLSLSRRIKELWTFGPLGQGDPNRQSTESAINHSISQVSQLLNTVEAANMTRLATEAGGEWQRLVHDAPDSSTATSGN
ncbi:hypothetical protein CDD81_211 [Ophiocordyceps australis]|uniref:Uncharacterized protein n=1 Tax=Ophiocordyceps australis TaxID=1399860 RepID=A0A2C5XL44_9HYPO|nr:hypothetical protein CDD81_211 [Ophiocordyceps australis]